jgi:hypothetical protein
MPSAQGATPLQRDAGRRFLAVPDADPVGCSGIYYANHQRAHTRLMPKNRSWDLEDQVLRKLIAEGRYAVDAAVEVNRSEAAVRLRAKLFGLSLLQRREAKGQCDMAPALHRIQCLICHLVEARPHISVPKSVVQPGPKQGPLGSARIGLPHRHGATRPLLAWRVRCKRCSSS